MGIWHNARSSYTGADGMERFVTGDYSVGQPVALMAGMLLKPSSDCVPALRTYLSSAAAQAALGMVANPAGQFVRSPGSFSDAEFDTEHKRPAGKAPAHGSIVICHLFLSQMSLPHARSEGSVSSRATGAVSRLRGACKGRFSAANADSTASESGRLSARKSGLRRLRVYVRFP
ncbi:hypothetical protein GWK53_17010 [Burkholderia cepacia]|uniref:hypothetical protein n=1 Tax=Burkholderia cepacia TaxID=292 RepID=UPI0013F3EAC2|nr:hypothetical protein [Burkholderia cepacia]NHB08204.1 hypothetical protein [Burkholderia cepacia]